MLIVTVVERYKLCYEFNQTQINASMLLKQKMIEKIVAIDINQQFISFFNEFLSVGIFQFKKIYNNFGCYNNQTDLVRTINKIYVFFEIIECG